MDKISFPPGKSREDASDLAKLMFALVRAQDALHDARTELFCALPRIKNATAKVLLKQLGDAEILAGRVEPLRVHAWLEIKRIRGGRGNDQGKDGAGAEADRGVPLDHAGAADRQRDAGPADDGKSPPRGQGE